MQAIEDIITKYAHTLGIMKNTALMLDDKILAEYKNVDLDVEWRMEVSTLNFAHGRANINPRFGNNIARDTSATRARRHISVLNADLICREIRHPFNRIII